MGERDFFETDSFQFGTNEEPGAAMILIAANTSNDQQPRSTDPDLASGTGGDAPTRDAEDAGDVLVHEVGHWLA